MKHTKGEWKIFPISNKLIQINSEKMYSIAYVWAINRELKEELEANAKLIAAAPDLLEVLIKLKEWEKTNFIEQSLLEKINNAINKATL